MRDDPPIVGSKWIRKKDDQGWKKGEIVTIEHRILSPFDGDKDVAYSGNRSLHHDKFYYKFDPMVEELDKIIGDIE